MTARNDRCRVQPRSPLSQWRHDAPVRCAGSPFIGTPLIGMSCLSSNRRRSHTTDRARRKRWRASRNRRAPSPAWCTDCSGTLRRSTPGRSCRHPPAERMPAQRRSCPRLRELRKPRDCTPSRRCNPSCSSKHRADCANSPPLWPKRRPKAVSHSHERRFWQRSMEPRLPSWHERAPRTLIHQARSDERSRTVRRRRAPLGVSRRTPLRRAGWCRAPHAHRWA